MVIVVLSEDPVPITSFWPTRKDRWLDGAGLGDLLLSAMTLQSSPASLRSVGHLREERITQKSI